MSVARAAEYTVNSTGDQVDEAAGSGGCKTAVATCTLRAAIEESNASIGVNDTIEFDFFFDGKIGDTIELGTSLPTIVDRVRVEGFPSPLQCETDYFAIPGPCVGIDGPSGGTAFRVEAERVVLIGFAISGAETAIEAVGAPGLDMWNDWIGIKLDGSAGPVETGISVDQGSNGPLIGGSSSVARMIFAHNTGVGLDIEGADAAVVRGSGFGVLPDGNTLAPNGTNIEITDAATGDKRVARGNWIGGTLDDEQLASSTCDGACNVISGATGSGIDLVGEEPDEKPASGSTRIFGNYIGLNAFGTTGIPNTLQGVLVGSAENVTVGGLRAGDRNMINGGATGVLAGTNVGNLTVENNWIGLDPTGTGMLAPPTSAGISIESGFQTEIAGNRISMLSGTAIEPGPREAVVRSNVIGEGVNGEDLPGGSIGIHLFGSCFLCALVEGNSIANAADYGILIENSKNEIYGNRIEGSGAAGIRIAGPPLAGFATRNMIGGDLAAEENTISESGGAAVQIAEVVEFGATRANQVARNNGALNGGPFIELLNGAQEEILPPAFSSSTQSGASGGSAAPGAVIRVFRKAGSSPGEIESFLAETVADESGDWAVAYPGPLPGGTMVAASQTTDEEGTSEFAFATTAAESPDGGGEEGGGPGGGPIAGPPAPDPDKTPPQTFVVKGPNKKSRSTTARFLFGSSESPSRFRCKLDRRPISSCESPRTYRGLRPGKHVFKVWATDASGNKDLSPAKRVFWVHAR
jgi:CSLREA domain-containing protein